MRSATMATVAAKKPAGKKIAGIKVPKKKAPAVRRAHLADEKYTGTEPKWDTERASQMPDDEFEHHLRRSFFYYNYHYTTKDLKPDFIRWLQEQKHFEISNADISKLIKSRRVPITACSLIAAHRVGMPMRPKIITYLQGAIQEVLEKFDYYQEDQLDDSPEVKPAAAFRVTIQDRLNEKASELIGEIEGWYDDMTQGNKEDPKVYEFLKTNNVPQASISKFEDVFARRRAELESAMNKEDEQLVEGYRHLKAADFRRRLAWLDLIQQGLDQYRAIKKATKKVRARKAPSKEKRGGKLKYAKGNDALKIVSINAADIVGATELWVYNIKTRKIGRYVPDTYAGALSVKGTTITGFDEHKSLSKTLRKPEQQLAEFMKISKAQMRKFLDTVKTTETKLNGRINADTLLLRVA